MIHGRTWKDSNGLWTGEIVYNTPSRFEIVNFPGKSENFEDLKNFLFKEIGVSEIFVMKTRYSLTGDTIKKD